MLRHAQMHPHPTERGEIVTHIERVGLPAFEPVVEFEELFGGIEYHVRGAWTQGLRLGLILPWRDGPDRKMDPRVCGYAENGHYFFECAIHHSAQCSFLIDEGRVLYVDLVPIALAIETYIESDALVDELFYEQPEWLCLLFGERPRGDHKVDENLQQLGMSVVPEATDVYTTWWRDEGARVHRAVFWNGVGDRDRIVANAKTEADAHRLVRALRGTSFEHNPDRLRWPWRPGPRQQV